MAQIASAVMLDIAYLYVSLYWVLYSRNFRLFAALIIFYVFRAIHLNIAKLEFPIDYYWEDPQIPSLVVKYGRFSDFFYSVWKNLISKGTCWIFNNLCFGNEKNWKKSNGLVFLYWITILSFCCHIFWNSLYNGCN